MFDTTYNYLSRIRNGDSRCSCSYSHELEGLGDRAIFLNTLRNLHGGCSPSTADMHGGILQTDRQTGKQMLCGRVLQWTKSSESFTGKRIQTGERRMHTHNQRASLYYVIFATMFEYE